MRKLLAESLIFLRIFRKKVISARFLPYSNVQIQSKRIMI